MLVIFINDYVAPFLSAAPRVESCASRLLAIPHHRVVGDCRPARARNFPPEAERIFRRRRRGCGAGRGATAHALNTGVDPPLGLAEGAPGGGEALDAVVDHEVAWLEPDVAEPG